jgi:hypothetical protein
MALPVPHPGQSILSDGRTVRSVAEYLASRVEKAPL